MPSKEEFGFRESVVMIIGTLTDAVQYWYNPRDGMDDMALGSLERAKGMIEETIEEVEEK